MADAKLSMADCGFVVGDRVRVTHHGDAWELLRSADGSETWDSLGHFELDTGVFSDGPYAGQTIGFIHEIPIPLDGGAVFGYGTKTSVDDFDHWGGADL